MNDVRSIDDEITRVLFTKCFVDIYTTNYSNDDAVPQQLLGCDVGSRGLSLSLRA